MEVVWSNNALLSAQAAADYAREEFGDFQVRKLREKIRLAIRRISSMPSSCPLEQNLQNIDPSIQYRYINVSSTNSRLRGLKARHLIGQSVRAVIL